MPTPSIADLRQLLAARFPKSQNRPSSVVPTGVAPLDEMLPGGLPASALTELVDAGSGGGDLVLASLLLTTRTARQRVALIDAADGFSPASHPPECLEHLVWARGNPGALSATWAAADLLLRDTHFAVVVLDLRGIAERELLRTPNTTWYRIQRILEQSSVAALALSSIPVAPSAVHRFRLGNRLSGDSWCVDRATLCQGLEPSHERRRAHANAVSA